MGSPDARRSGRKGSGLSLERCSSRSRSTSVCERIARRETGLLPGVIWDFHCSILDPDIELIVSQAKAAIHSCQGPTFFYVGVSRYLMRRWLGGDELSFEQAHSSKWGRLHVLSTHSQNVGKSEDALIKILRRDLGGQLLCQHTERRWWGLALQTQFVVHMRGAHQIASRSPAQRQFVWVVS